MDQKKLEKHRNIRKEIKRLERRIEKMSWQVNDGKLEFDRVTGSSPEHPYTPVSYTIAGYSDRGRAKCITKLREKMSEFKTVLEEEALEVETWIQSVDDSLTRDILRLRYIDGLRLQEVASEIGYSDRQVIRKILAVVNSSPHVTK